MDFKSLSISRRSIRSFKPDLYCIQDTAVAVIPIGYPNLGQSAPKRRPLHEVVTMIGKNLHEVDDK